MRQRHEAWRTARSLAAAGSPGGAPAGAGLLTRARAFAVPEADWLEQRGRFALVRWSLLFAGLLGYIFVTTTYRLPIGDVSMVLALIGLLLQGGALRFPAEASIYLAVLFWALVGAAVSPYSAIAFDALLVEAKVGLIFLAVVNALRTRAHIRFFIVFFLACFGSHPARGAVMNFLTHNTLFGRAAWNHIFANPNDLAALTLLQLSMALGLLATEKKGIIRLGALSAVIVFPVVILMTQSRAVMIGLGLFILMMLAGQKRKARTLMVIAGVAAIVIAISPSGVWKRMSGLSHATNTEDLQAVDQEGSAAQRWAIWQAGAKVVRRYPVFGVGTGAYPEGNVSVAPLLGKRDAHSTYVTLAGENGIPGLLLFLALVGVSLRHARRTRKRCQVLLPRAAQQLRFLELGLIAFLVAGIWGSYSKLAFLYVHIGLMWAVGRACEADLRAMAVSGRTTGPPLPPVPRRGRGGAT